ncbi:MAG: type II toxin-antitoxin system HicA family toxin [Lachnospiraceae bacterium]|nr:type II toxin-antitoxin system HicA family toxin [Lachnospiraceae bacterium]
MAKDIYMDIMCGNRDRNIRFADLQSLLKIKGFSYRVKGDHYIYWHKDIPEIVNIQPDGNKAKPYQIKQIRMLFEKYFI